MVAEQMCRNCMEPLKKNEDENYLIILLAPKNCEDMKVSKINEPVWQQMTEQEKSEDSFWQRLQGNCIALGKLLPH